MIYLFTGTPGASKTLNTVSDLVKNNNGERDIYYNNVPLLVLDFEVCKSFSGWFFGYYFDNVFLPNNKKPQINKLKKVLKKISDNGDTLELKHLPWLKAQYESHNYLKTWLFWVNRLYSKGQLKSLNDFLSNSPDNDVTEENLKQFHLHFIHFDDPHTWFDLPKQSIIFIDECQQFFPPRGVGSKVPKYISEFETHRHKGFDLYLITQNPKLFDVNIRRLVNYHTHFYNSLGGNRVTKYKKSKAIDVDNVFDLKETSKSIIKRPVKFYGSYNSSELHTNKFQMPKFIYFGAFAILALIIAAVVGYNKVNSLGNSDIKNDIKNSSVSSQVNISDSPIQKIDEPKSAYDKFIIDKLHLWLKDVYITGSTLVRHNDGSTNYEYVFESVDGFLFDPESLSIKLFPIGFCMTKAKFNSYVFYITCNPRKKIIHPLDIKDKDRNSESELRSKSLENSNSSLS